MNRTYHIRSSAMAAWIADIRHSAIAMILNRREERHGVVGIPVQMTGAGTLQETVCSDNAQGDFHIGLFDLDCTMHAIRFVMDAEDPQDHAGQFRLGLDYLLVNIFYLRAEIVSPANEQRFSSGFGVQKGFTGVGRGVDYACHLLWPFGGMHGSSLWISH